MLLEGVLEHPDLLVAKILVDVQDEKVPVRIMNMSQCPARIASGTVIANCSKVEVIDKTQKVYDPANDNSHLQSVVANSTKHLNSKQREQLLKMILENRDVLSKGSGDMGRTSLTRHRIDTGNNSPIKVPPRKIPLAKRECAKELVQQMHKEGIIEPSQSPWCSPIVLVKKKDGSQRFCVDYRRLNDITKKDSFPLPESI